MSIDDGEDEEMVKNKDKILLVDVIVLISLKIEYWLEIKNSTKILI